MPEVRYAGIPLLVTLASIGLLFSVAVLSDGAFAPYYLVWNVCLAWVPFGLALCLRRLLRRHLWSSWSALATTALWLAFLPNTFYIISDFVHLPEADSDWLLFAVVVFAAFANAGIVLGVGSLLVVHVELGKRLGRRRAAMLVSAVLLLCSVAIYIGRDLRWNSWDIIINPGGVLFDLSERLIHPSQYGEVLVAVLPFFVLLLCVYGIAWQGILLRGGRGRRASAP